MKWLDQYIGQQIRKPTGLFGKALGHLMAREHIGLNDWMLESMNIGPNETVLDVGCGGGMTLRMLSQIAHEGTCFGLDYSQTMVKQAARRNRTAVAHGRVAVVCGDVGDLPFQDSSFDAACCVETFYFWPDPDLGLSEIARVLRPGGRIALTMDISKESTDGSISENVGDRLNFSVYSGDEISAKLAQAGFCEPN